MEIEVFADADLVARKAAKLIAAEARTAAAVRGAFVMAVSGGRTPWIMLRNLAQEDMPWNAVHVVLVDERVAPDGHLDRNEYPGHSRGRNLRGKCGTANL